MKITSQEEYGLRILLRIAAMNEPPAVAFISDRGVDRNALKLLIAMKAFSARGLAR